MSNTLQSIVHRYLAQDFTAENWQTHLNTFRKAVAPAIRTTPRNGEVVCLYTDGSFRPGKDNLSQQGAWAALLCMPLDEGLEDSCAHSDLTIAGRIEPSSAILTAPRCELMAVIKGFELMARAFSQEVDQLVVHSDSQYVVQCGQGTWKRKTNHDLWQRLDKASEGLAKTITYRWVRGHNGNPHNERVDKLARACLNA